MASRVAYSGGIYYPLNEQRLEIRLLTLLPYTKPGPLNCTLQTYSLQDVTQQYKDFQSSHASTVCSSRALTSKWRRECTPGDLRGQTSLNRIHATHPPPSMHSFNWGDYAALSYAWGDEWNMGSIILNGHQVEVTASLEAALRNFSSNSEFEDDFRLWVDAICINQNDLPERAEQVQRMRDIYGNAWSVISWLGEESRQSHSAIQLLHDIAGFSRANCVEQLQGALRQHHYYLGKGCWMALLELMERRYWFRLWIVQEMVMGGSATLIRCGHSSIGWDDFCAAVKYLEESLWLLKDEILVKEIQAFNLQRSPAWTTASLHLVNYDISELSKREEQGGAYLSFGRLLDLSNSALCRDPRDTVYALLGMLPPVVVESLRPDYTLDPAMVMAWTARRFIEAFDNLEPLRDGNPWGPSGSPSWAADWRWNGRIRWSRIENELWGPSWMKGDPSGGQVLPFCASGDMRHDTTFSDDCTILTCSGIIVDAISGLGACPTSYFTWDKDSVVHDDTWSSAYGTEEATKEALIRMLVLDRGKDGQRATERHSVVLTLPSNFDLAEPQFTSRGWHWLAGQRGYYFRWEAFRALNANFRMGKYRMGEFFSDQVLEHGSEEDYTEAYCCSERASKTKRFVTTRNGMMGWVTANIDGGPSEQVQLGDSIAMLFGCSTPVVVRPDGGRWIVLGEAYEHGLMEGEALESMCDGQNQVRSFTFW